MLEFRYAGIVDKIAAHVDGTLCYLQGGLLIAGLPLQIAGVSWVFTWPASAELASQDLGNALLQGWHARLFALLEGR
jgi:hypothetical protein